MGMPLRALIIEDSEEDALLLEIELRRGGFEPVCERLDTPEKLSAALGEKEWNIVISDCIMPQFSGLAALRLVQERRPDLPFIIVSGSIGEDIAVEAMKAGAHDYIMKGSLFRLCPAITRELREAEVRRERLKAEEALRKSHEELEIKVLERTGELTWINKALNLEILQRRKAEEALRRSHIELEVLNRELISLNSELAIRRREAEDARAVAEAANRAKSEFLANMSHELRTPLNSIIGFSEILIDGMAGATTEQQKEYLGDILDSGRHLLDLINDILDLSKVEAGRLGPDISLFSLNELIESGAVMFREKALRHGIRMSTDICGNIGMIRADKRKIKQVLFNLLGNALKFTPDGGSVRIAAHLSSDAGGRGNALHPRDGDFVEISVEDTGVGIAAEDLPRLFLPFEQLNTRLADKYQGTGLGLHLSKKFIELHGGSIRAESELGKGSRFTFTIPLQQPPADRDNAEAGEAG